jgi:oligopeptide/dipeptide ABC transporter ATP-binding protein
MTSSVIASPLLEVRDLEVHLFTKRGIGRALRDVSFRLYPGQTLGLVGESGSGKSLTALSLIKLNPRPTSKIVRGEVVFHGEDLLKKTDAEMRRYRGKGIALVIQDPMSALDPVFSIGNQICETLRTHYGARGRSAKDIAIRLLEQVGLPEPASRLGYFPHQFSGGMRQRVVSALALAGTPSVLIADEPTTALDVAAQATYLSMLKEVQKKDGMGILFVTHDFGAVARMCDRVAVMYAGRIVEIASTADLFAAPKHPYTEALLNSVPNVERTPDRLMTIRGQPPSIFDTTQGCPFANRCSYVMDRCRSEMPPEVPTGQDATVRCWRYP